MSRKPFAPAGRPSALATTNPTALPSDICPVCKRVRYLNTDMRFLINPECYHPMCSQCVDTIFKSGPAQCPYAACQRTLRYRGFRDAYFGDLSVEREVDIRRRVGTVFNNVQDDFETLRDYNNYLQEVEDLTFSLVSGTEEERRAAEAQLLAYEQKHRADIERNKKKAGNAEEQRRQRELEERAAADARRAEELREEERARAEEATLNREVMEALSRGEPGSASEIQERIIAQKRARLAQINGTHFPDSAQQPSMLSIRGLRQKKSKFADDEEDALKPYDPFMGLDLTPSHYKLHDHYEDSWLDAARTTSDHRVPGWSAQAYCARAMFEAFSGLGVMVEDEKHAGNAAVGTAGARLAVERSQAGGALGRSAMEIDDVF